MYVYMYIFWYKRAVFFCLPSDCRREFSASCSMWGPWVNGLPGKSCMWCLGFFDMCSNEISKSHPKRRHPKSLFWTHRFQKKKSVWTLHHACRAWENVLCPAILCDLFGIVKWPSTGDQLVKLNHLVIFVPTIFPNPSQTRHPKICFEHSLPIAVSRPCFFQILKIIYYQ